MEKAETLFHGGVPLGKEEDILAIRGPDKPHHEIEFQLSPSVFPENGKKVCESVEIDIFVEAASYSRRGGFEGKK